MNSPAGDNGAAVGVQREIRSPGSVMKRSGGGGVVVGGNAGRRQVPAPTWSWLAAAFLRSSLVRR
jgi:hypothetical protein